MYINTETLACVSYGTLLALHPNTSIPVGDDFVPPAPYVFVLPSDKPAFDKRTQQVREGKPVLVGGTHVQGWDIIEIFPTQAERDASIAADAAANDANRVAALWQAAHDYEYAQVSGSAIGLLAMGVMAQKPKCLAVQGWLNGIWSAYYSRKSSGSTDCDYSVVGMCPYSVPELMAELGL